MADDLAAKLAHAFTLAAGRMADHSPAALPVASVRSILAADLRVILATDLPEWYAGYQAAQDDAAGAERDAWRPIPGEGPGWQQTAAGAGAYVDHSPDPFELERAARALLHRLEHMTTAEFSNGGERAERWALAAALGIDATVGDRDAAALDRIAEMLRAGVDLDGSDASDSVADVVAATGRDVRRYDDPTRDPSFIGWSGPRLSDLSGGAS